QAVLLPPQDTRVSQTDCKLCTNQIRKAQEPPVRGFRSDGENCFYFTTEMTDSESWRCGSHELLFREYGISQPTAELLPEPATEFPVCSRRMTARRRMCHRSTCK